MTHKKGQVAIEYLMNYGWALLVLAIVIAAILATGVFTPNYFVMDECNFGSSFRCASQIVYNETSTRMLFNLTNTMSYPVRLKNITFSVENPSTGTPSTISKELNLTLNNSGSWTDYNIPLSQTGLSFQKGNSKKLTATLTYYVCAEEVNYQCVPEERFLRTVSGRVVTQVS